MRRRTLLAALGGSATAAASAGCLARVEDALDRTTRLGWLGAHNRDVEPHRFDLRVERGGTVVHESSHEIRGRDGNYVHGAVADCTWGDADGRYRVGARVDSRDWTWESLSALDEAYRTPVDCATAGVEYGDGEVSVRLQAGCSQVAGYDGGCAFADDAEPEE